MVNAQCLSQSCITACYVAAFGWGLSVVQCIMPRRRVKLSLLGRRTKAYTPPTLFGNQNF